MCLLKLKQNILKINKLLQLINQSDARVKKDRKKYTFFFYVNYIYIPSKNNRKRNKFLKKEIIERILYPFFSIQGNLHFSGYITSQREKKSYPINLIEFLNSLS